MLGPLGWAQGCCQPPLVPAWSLSGAATRGGLWHQHGAEVAAGDRAQPRAARKPHKAPQSPCPFSHPATPLQPRATCRIPAHTGDVGLAGGVCPHPLPVGCRHPAVGQRLGDRDEARGGQAGAGSRLLQVGTQPPVWAPRVRAEPPGGLGTSLAASSGCQSVCLGRQPRPQPRAAVPGRAGQGREPGHGAAARQGSPGLTAIRAPGRSSLLGHPATGVPRGLSSPTESQRLPRSAGTGGSRKRCRIRDEAEVCSTPAPAPARRL